MLRWDTRLERWLASRPPFDAAFAEIVERHGLGGHVDLHEIFGRGHFSLTLFRILHPGDYFARPLPEAFVAEVRFLAARYGWGGALRMAPYGRTLAQIRGVQAIAALECRDLRRLTRHYWLADRGVFIFAQRGILEA